MTEMPPEFLVDIPPGCYKDICYLPEQDKEYTDALQIIAEADEISILPVTIPLSDPEVLSILIVCTKELAFVFDILAYGGVPQEIYNIFLKDQKKIVYSAKKTLQRMSVAPDTKLPGLVDIEKMDYIFVTTFHPERPPQRKLLPCIEEFFPQVTNWVDITALLFIINWTDRPLRQKQHLHMARLASFLIPTYKILNKEVLDLFA